MSRTFRAQGSLGTAPMIRVWAILIMLNLIAIILLVVFAAIVYHRLAFDRISPPVYSIWVRPGETWRRAEFTISPSYGVEVAIDGGSIFNYRFERRQPDEHRNSEDRPRLVASYLEIPRGLDNYNWHFVNNVNENTTNIIAKIATTDLKKAYLTPLTTPPNVLPILKQGMGYLVISAPKSDSQFLIVCMTYSNDRGTAFVDPPQFYFTPFYMKTNRKARSEPARVTGLQYDQLAADFSCANL